MHSQSKKKNYDYRANIMLLGEFPAGKSALVEAYCSHKFTGIVSGPIIGLGHTQKTVEINQRIFEVGILDTNLAEWFRNHLSVGLKMTHGFLFMYSVIDRNSFFQLKNLLKLIEDSEYGHLPRVLVGTSIDLDEYDPTKEDQELQRVVSYDEAEEFAEKNNMLYFEVSSAKFKNLDQPFEALLEVLLDKWENEEGEKWRKNTFTLRNQKSKGAVDQSKCSACGP